MSIRFSCECGKTFRVADQYAGKRAKCPNCGRALVVPTARAPKGAEPEPGVKRYTCVVCGDSFSQEEVVQHEAQVMCEGCAPTAQPAAQAPVVPIQTQRGSGGALAAPIATPHGAPSRAEGPVRRVRPISKTFYVGSCLGARLLGTLIICCVLLGAGGTTATTATPDADSVFRTLESLGVLLSFAGIIMGLVILHKMWAAIQAGPARSTPSNAVACLFVPVYNFYWVFQAYWGWTHDYNRFVALRRVRAPAMPSDVAFLLCVFMLVAVAAVYLSSFAGFPIVGLLVVTVVDVIEALFFSRACDGINALATLPGEIIWNRERLTEEPRLKKTCGLATASLVLALLGLGTMGVTAVVGLVLGLVAVRKIKSSGGTVRGRGRAIAGVVISGVLTLILFLALVLVLSTKM